MGMWCGDREDKAGLPGTKGWEVESHSGRFAFENLCRLVGKITLVCGKNLVNKVKCWIIPVSLWEKFGAQSIVLDNSRQFVGKIRWTKVQCWIIPVSLWEKFVGLQKPPENTRRYTGKNYQIIYVFLLRYRVSQRLFDGKFAETLNSVWVLG